MVKTLYNLSQLRDAKFGQPDPRHGLKLLWWFAHDYVDIDFNGLYTRHDPANGRFGFRRFNNTERILSINHQYYKTGNLTHAILPDYVTEYYTGYSDTSNTDRLIVSVCSRNNGKVWLNDIHVTQHLGKVQFDRNRTYRISLDLIKDIKNLSRAEFLKQMNSKQNSLSIEIEPEPEDSTHEQQRSYNSTEKDCETCSVLFVVLLLFVLLYVYLHKF